MHFTTNVKLLIFFINWIVFWYQEVIKECYFVLCYKTTIYIKNGENGYIMHYQKDWMH